VKVEEFIICLYSFTFSAVISKQLLVFPFWLSLHFIASFIDVEWIITKYRKREMRNTNYWRENTSWQLHAFIFLPTQHQHNDKYEDEPLIKTQIHYFQYWRFRLSQMWTNARIHLVLARPAAPIRMEVTRAHAMMATPVTEKIAKVCLICLLSLIIEQNGFAEMACYFRLIQKM